MKIEMLERKITDKIMDIVEKTLKGNRLKLHEDQ